MYNKKIADISMTKVVKSEGMEPGTQKRNKSKVRKRKRESGNRKRRE